MSLLNDKVLWMGRPLIRPYFMNHLSRLGSAVLFFIITGTFLCLLFSLSGDGIHWNRMGEAGVLIIFPALILFIYNLIIFKLTQYHITEKTVYIRKGFLKSKLIRLDKKKIVLIDIAESKIEKKYHTGTVLIHIGELKDNDGHEEKIFYKLESIENPEQVIRLL